MAEGKTITIIQRGKAPEPTKKEAYLLVHPILSGCNGGDFRVGAKVIAKKFDTLYPLKITGTVEVFYERFDGHDWSKNTRGVSFNVALDIPIGSDTTFVEKHNLEDYPSPPIVWSRIYDFKWTNVTISDSEYEPLSYHGSKTFIECLQEP